MKRVVVGVISRNNKSGEKEYLLISAKKDFGKFTGYYYPPGGHLEEGENEVVALVREIREELGVEVMPTEEVAVTPGDVKDQMTHWWLCECRDFQFKPQEDEIADIRWFSEEEIKNSNKTWPATKKFFEEHVYAKR